MNKDFTNLDTNPFAHCDRGAVAQWLSHIHKFMQKFTLYPKSGRAVVGISGGRDSMALAVAMLLLKRRGHLKNLRFIHINHKLRVGNDEEAKFLKRQMSKWGLDLEVHELSWPSKISTNIEHEARYQRYQIFNSVVNKDEAFFLAHHLDDSFEWSLLQQMRSSHLLSSVGIPLKRGIYRRPFLCVSRNQINKFIQDLKIPYKDDPSNENIQFERNFLRQQVIPKLAKRYPQYLKHYAYRSNEMAKKLGVYAIKEECALEVVRFEQGSFIIDRSYQNQFQFADERIIKEIHRLSSTGRGTYSKQVQKIIEAVAHFRFGPLTLTGGLECYLSPNIIMLIKKSHEYELNKRGIKSLENLNFKQYSLRQFQVALDEKIQEKHAQNQYPFLTLLENAPKEWQKQKAHPARPLLCDLLDQGPYSYWPALDLLRVWLKNPLFRNQTFSLCLL